MEHKFLNQSFETSVKNGQNYSEIKPLLDEIKKYETLISAIPGGIAITKADADFTHIYSNQGFFELMGYSEEEFFELFPHGGAGILHPDSKESAIHDALEQMHKTGAFSVKTRIIHKTKGGVWVHFNGRLLKNEDGSANIYMVMVDITEHMLTLERLEQEQSFNSLVSSLSDDAFFDCDILGGIIRYSKNFAQRFSIDEIMYDYPQSMIGRGIIAKDSIHLYQNRFFIDTTDVIEEELHLVLPSGEDAWYLYHYNIIFDSLGLPVRAVGKMSDITKHHTKLAQLSKTVEEEQQFRASVLADSTSTFEYNLTKNKVISIQETNSSFFKDREYSYSELTEYISANIIHPDDRALQAGNTSREELLANYHLGKHETSIDFRRLLPNGEFMWVRSHTSLYEDKLTGDVKGFTYVKDIHNEKMAQLELKQKAECDPLTGLYNKSTTENLIKNELANLTQDVQHALLIIDVDNFKDINDNLGHLSGDIVLTSLSDKLKMLFRANDIIGRIGGDEFFVFMRNIPSFDIVVSKAKEINKAFKNTYSEKGVNCTISASIGIVSCPKFGSDFETLYKNADTALYLTKEKGKDSFTIFEGQSGANYKSARTTVDSLQNLPQKSFRENKVEYLFKLLYGSNDTNSAVSCALELMRDHFNFSRGYIYETDSDNKWILNTFECCAEDIAPFIDKMPNISVDAISTISASFFEKKYFVLENPNKMSLSEKQMLKLREIKSMFHFGIFEQNTLMGLIGFEDCHNERRLTPVEIDELATICNVLATFITKQRSNDTAEQNLRTISTVMDNIDNFTYVINKDTFEILFMNQNTRDITGGNEAFDTCYKLFRGNEYPCDDCPVKGLRGDNTKYTTLIHNKKFNIWTETTATNIDWAECKNACLVNCVDITAYKKDEPML